LGPPSLLFIVYRDLNLRGESDRKLVARSPLSGALCSCMSTALYDLIDCKGKTYEMRIISGT
jgi:hypothetical protein